MKSHVLFRGVVHLVAPLLAAVGLVTVATPASAGTSEFIAAVNMERTSRGLPAYEVSSDLSRVAQAWSDHMAATGTLAHNPNVSAQVTAWRAVGENVGRGPDELSVHKALLASPSHAANIFDREFFQIGMGITARNGNVWVTQVFRQPSTRTVPTLYKTPHSSQIYKVVNGAAQSVGFSEWASYGYPAPQASPTWYVRYPWSSSVYAVTFWPAAWQWERISFDQWRTAGFPAVRHAGWIDGSSLHKSSADPRIFISDPDGRQHQLTYDEWAATPFRAPTVTG